MHYDEFQVILNNLMFRNARSVLLGEDLLRNTNVYLLRGLVQLGRHLSTNPDIKDAMSPEDVFHK